MRSRAAPRLLGRETCNELGRRGSRVDAGVRSGHAEPMVPSRMRAAVYKGDRSIEVEDYPTPVVGPDDVLLEVSHCGVCGSDIHFVLEGWSAPNRVHGHEFSGTVVAIGDGVTSWRVGDSVVGGPSVRCGECEYNNDQSKALLHAFTPRNLTAL